MVGFARMPGIVRWIVPVLTVATTSGSIVAFLWAPADGDDALALVLLGAVFGGGLACAVATVAQAAAMAVRERPGALPFFRRAMLLVKLGLVPLYLAGALMVLFASVMAIHPVLAAVLPLLTIAAPLVAFGWILMACCSAWTIAYAAGLWRAGRLAAGECVAYCVLSFFFVADVACAIVLFIRGRSRELDASGAPQIEEVAWHS